MKHIVKNTIIQYNLIEKDDNIIIGVSGGHDSMTLLYVLMDLSSSINFKIHVAHVNHGVRGEDADEDEKYVKKVCSDFNIPFYSKKVNMDEYAKKYKLTKEEAGREIRYSFFREILNRFKKGKIAVAHNKNDQAETLIMRFIRGTGIDGLRGMEYKNGDIIRPLLDVGREEIEKYCEENNIEPRIDRTNFETIYGRNKVRLELIPYIVENFNLGIIDTLSRTSKIMKNDSDFLISYTKKCYEDIVIMEDELSIHINNEKFLKLHNAIRNRVLRYSLEKINGNLQGIEEKHIKDIIKLANSKTTGKLINISNNIIVRKNYNNLIVEKNAIRERISYNYKVGINTVTLIEELDAKIEAKILPVSLIDLNFSNRFIKYFDYDKLSDNIYIRNRKNGDRFTPMGMNGSKKLKDFFIDEKIPKEYRDIIPIIEHDGDIMWIVGYRISEKYKITSNTKNVLVLKYINT
ncbi:tRNA(Ile)-lysidine synthase TilS [Gottschalkia purinilytica]|uniref:tRNA(Ile)-lysidine synthase n=1 Tax=Gottschalkia purinilytica TaxID=1503 RepID=A0A0L0W931_GOTPU|nr:tRNA lysidine(34) synthetase TilS [Gottschalkia purinilytica]KNF07820.1 tRNA(Ile)-lysidine synthase TilS [Gottschalkia purinilytica]